MTVVLAAATPEAGMRPEHIAERVGHKDGGRLILERYRHLYPAELTVQLARYDQHVRGADIDAGEAAGA